MTRLMNDSVSRAVSGSSISEIVYSAGEVGRFYRSAIDWANRVRNIHVDDTWRQLAYELALASAEILEETEAFGPRLMEAIVAAAASPEEQVLIEITFEVRAGNIDRVNEEIARIARSRQGHA